MAAENKGSEALDIREVLSGLTPEGADPGALGASLTFQTIGSDTVISVDTDAPGPAMHLNIVTLHNLTHVTLQDLLNAVPSDGN
jgi:hypothetical protein